jgi:hypothetical protein
LASSKRPPTEGEIILNSKLDTLYTHPFHIGTTGEGRYFNVVTLDDGSEKVELELTPRIRVSVVFIKEKKAVTGVHIAKFRFNKRLGWREDKTEQIRLTPISFGKVVGLLRFLTEIDLGGIHERRIKLADDELPEIDSSTKTKIRTLLSRRDGAAMIEELLRSNILSHRDIVNSGYRKAQLRTFEQLLREPGFKEEYRREQGIVKEGAETLWQRFFERNPWIFGYGLHYIWCSNLPDAKLEQVVSGFDFGKEGKRVDALLHTSATVRQFVLAEIKTPETLLLGKSPRPGVWSPTADLLDGVAQIQKTVSRFKQQYFERVQLAGPEGDPIGTEVFNVSPRSFLLVGNLDQFRSSGGVNWDKYSSFQLFRTSVRDPEIITFDELYARATAIVGHGERGGDAAP